MFTGPFGGPRNVHHIFYRWPALKPAIERFAHALQRAIQDAGVHPLGELRIAVPGAGRDVVEGHAALTRGNPRGMPRLIGAHVCGPARGSDGPREAAVVVRPPRLRLHKEPPRGELVIVEVTPWAEPAFR